MNQGHFNCTQMLKTAFAALSSNVLLVQGAVAPVVIDTVVENNCFHVSNLCTVQGRQSLLYQQVILPENLLLSGYA